MKKEIGIIAAPFAPLNPDSTINADLIPDYCLFLERNNVEGVFINGTTGEGPSLTQKEKQILTTAWTSCTGDSRKMKVINLVGGTSYMECIENATFSREAGVDAIAVIGPYFFKPSEPGQLAEFIALIGESVPEMPLYYYHIPSITGVSLPMIDFLREVSCMLNNFRGIKYTHEDMMDYMSCLDYDKGKYDILWGRDECMLSALSVGARGFVGSTYNYAAPLYHALIRAFTEGELIRAKEYQQKSAAIVNLLGRYGGIGTGKAFMKYAGIDCGKYRPPVKNISDDMYRVFAEDVKALNIDYLFSE